MKHSHFPDSPQENEKLVAFLRRHEPQGPPIATDHQDQLLHRVTRAPQFQPQRSRKWWIIPTAILIGGGLWWGWQRSSSWIPVGDRLAPQTVAIQTMTAEETAALEAFLVSSWQGVLETDSTTDLDDPLLDFERLYYLD